MAITNEFIFNHYTRYKYSYIVYSREDGVNPSLPRNCKRHAFLLHGNVSRRFSSEIESSKSGLFHWPTALFIKLKRRTESARAASQDTCSCHDASLSRVKSASMIKSKDLIIDAAFALELP